MLAVNTAGAAVRVCVRTPGQTGAAQHWLQAGHEVVAVGDSWHIHTSSRMIRDISSAQRQAAAHPQRCVLPGPAQILSADCTPNDEHEQQSCAEQGLSPEKQTQGKLASSSGSPVTRELRASRGKLWLSARLGHFAAQIQDWFHSEVIGPVSLVQRKPLGHPWCCLSAAP